MHLFPRCATCTKSECSRKPPLIIVIHLSVGISHPRPLSDTQPRHVFDACTMAYHPCKSVKLQMHPNPRFISRLQEAELGLRGRSSQFLPMTSPPSKKDELSALLQEDQAHDANQSRLLSGDTTDECVSKAPFQYLITIREILSLNQMTIDGTATMRGYYPALLATARDIFNLAITASGADGVHIRIH